MAYGICKVCGCTENDPCFNPKHGACWWVDDSHELCSHCADKDIYNDPETIHCVCSSDPYNVAIEEKLVCCHCKHWHKDKECLDVEDENAFGDCDFVQQGTYGSDLVCIDFEEKVD